MIAARPLRQSTALRLWPTATSPTIPSPAAATFTSPISRPFRRRIHHVPRLSHDEHFREHGVGRMLSPAGYELAWTQYQQWLVDNLNRHTTGTKDADRSTKELLLEHARTPTRAALFNFASMAWNTHHTMTTLSPNPSSIEDVEKSGSTFNSRIDKCFSSFDTLKATFIATADAMFGPGFVWLVRNTHARSDSPPGDPQFLILCTYLAGSPLPSAHWRRQPLDMNVQNPVDLYSGAGGANEFSHIRTPSNLPLLHEMQMSSEDYNNSQSSDSPESSPTTSDSSTTPPSTIQSTNSSEASKPLESASSPSSTSSESSTDPSSDPEATPPLNDRPWILESPKSTATGGGALGQGVRTNVLRTHAGAFGDWSGSSESKMALGGAPLEIVLGVCTWEHFWLRDFGVGGKRRYLEAWWESVDWFSVEKNAALASPGLKKNEPSEGRFKGRRF